MKAAVIALAIAVISAAVIVSLFRYLIGLGVAVPAIGGLGAAAIDTLATLLIFGALLAVALVFLVRDKRLRSLAGPTPLRMLAWGLPIGAVGLCLALAYAAVAIEVGRGGGAASPMIVLGLFMMAFQAGVEEVYFRGWLQPILVNAWGSLVGIIVVAVAFALLHVAGGARAPLALLNIFLAGVLFSVLALRSGGIALSTGAHFAWNASETLVFGLDPNPGVGSFGAFFNLDMVGGSIWGGSEQGLNGSIGVSLVLIALILPFIVWRKPAAIAKVSPG